MLTRSTQTQERWETHAHLNIPRWQTKWKGWWRFPAWFLANKTKASNTRGQSKKTKMWTGRRNLPTKETSRRLPYFGKRIAVLFVFVFTLRLFILFFTRACVCFEPALVSNNVFFLCSFEFLTFRWCDAQHTSFPCCPFFSCQKPATQYSFERKTFCHRQVVA